jgi:DNA/RNA-binding domain of Phe-tRNA-synthetase-like protein
VIAATPPIALAPDVRGVARLGVVHATGLCVAPSGEALVREMEALAAEYAARWAGHAPGEIDALRPARDLYKAFGIDPTRTRPSSEALLRRALAGKALPRISNAVDLANLLALRFLLPIGLYDMARIDGPIEFRRGQAGERFAGIRKDDVHVEGRPVMADRLGAFGNPTSDSLRTSVTEATRSLLLVIFAPAAYDAARLDGHVAFTEAAVREHLTAS